MKRTKARIDHLERLETLALLSTLVPQGPAEIAPATSHDKAQRLHLNGVVSGQMTPGFTVDTGTNHNLSGSGNLGGLSTFQVTGDVERTGYILFKNRPVNGTLHLKNHNGTITIHLSSNNPVDGPSGLPDRINYVITRGTGKYAHATDHGTAHVSFQIPVDLGSPSGFSITLHSTM